MDETLEYRTALNQNAPSQTELEFVTMMETKDYPPNKLRPHMIRKLEAKAKKMYIHLEEQSVIRCRLAVPTTFGVGTIYLSITFLPLCTLLEHSPVWSFIFTAPVGFLVVMVLFAVAHTVIALIPAGTSIRIRTQFWNDLKRIFGAK